MRLGERVFGSEEWREIPDTEGWYEASSLGRIRSWRVQGYPDRQRREPFIRRVQLDRNGYETITLHCAGRSWHLTVNQAVALAFFGDPGPGFQAAHKNGIRHDNRVENLEWKTPLDNAADKVLHGTQTAGEDHGSAKLNWAQVNDLRDSYWAWVRERAAELGVGNQHIDKIVRGKLWRV